MTAPGTGKSRLEYLDTAKGFAAASVVLLHLFGTSTLFTTLAPWHIWQAMPIFLMVAGITGVLSCRKCSGIIQDLGRERLIQDLKSYYISLPGKVLPLYIPYAVVVLAFYMWTREPLGLELFGNTMIMGYLGPGGYFVPLIVQHLIFFPLVLALRPRMGSDLKFLGAALVISALCELPFAFVDLEAGRYIYRIFYFRYLFACCLGAVLADGNPFQPKTFRLLVGISVVYMAMVSLFSSPGATPPSYWNLFFIRADDWYFQHYPAYFYTAFLVFTVFRDNEHRLPWRDKLIKLGKSSYDIFIFQMVFFITVGLSLKQAFGWADYPFLMKVMIFFVCLWGGLLLTRAKKWWHDAKKQTATAKI